MSISVRLCVVLSFYGGCPAGRVRHNVKISVYLCLHLCICVCCHFIYCLNDQAHFAWFTSWVPRGQLGGRRGPSMEDDLWRKTTFDGRHPLMEDDLWRKKTFDGRQPLTEDDLWRKTTFDGRRPLKEDNLWQKTTFDGRWPLMEDNLWWMTTFDRRRPLTEDEALATLWLLPPCGHFLDLIVYKVIKL